MQATEFTHRELCTAVERELTFRRRVYPKWIEAGRYTQAKADREIRMFEAIRADYHTKAEAEEKAGRLL